jgi:hypothetical protein
LTHNGKQLVRALLSFRSEKSLHNWALGDVERFLRMKSYPILTEGVTTRKEAENDPVYFQNTSYLQIQFPGWKSKCWLVTHHFSERETETLTHRILCLGAQTEHAKCILQSIKMQIKWRLVLVMAKNRRVLPEHFTQCQRIASIPKKIKSSKASLMKSTIN